MSRSKRILPGSRLQWAAWIMALALHALVLILIGPLQSKRPPAPPAVVMTVLPTAPKAELTEPVAPVEPAPPPPAPAVAQPPQRPSPAPVLASTAKAPPDAPAVQLAAAPPEQPVPTAKQATATETPASPVVARPAPPVLRPAVYRAAYLNNPEPTYPPMSRRAGESGRVMLDVLVSAEGRAQTVKLHTSCGYPRLDMAAIEAVRNWRFEPAREGERAIASPVLIPIEFTLE